MKIKHLLILTLISLSWSFADVLLRIDGYTLSRKEFESLFSSYWRDIFHIPIHRASASDRRDFLIEYARCKLVLLGAREENLSVGEEKLKLALRERIGKLSVPPVVKELLRCELTVERVMEETQSDIDLSEEALRAYYILNKRDFYFPDRIMLLRVFVKDQSKLSTVRNILDYSDKVYIKGVVLGKPMWYSLQTLPIVIKRSLPSYRKGEVSKPIPVEGGYLLVKVLDRKKAGILPFEEAKGMIRDKIVKEYKEEVLRRWLRNVAQRHHIELNTESLF